MVECVSSTDDENRDVPRLDFVQKWYSQICMVNNVLSFFSITDFVAGETPLPAPPHSDLDPTETEPPTHPITKLFVAPAIRCDLEGDRVGSTKGTSFADQRRVEQTLEQLLSHILDPPR